MPHPVDVEVGRRVRIRRQQLNMSQTDLAKQLKLTFQQIQKYEKGTNRVSCSRLFEMAKAMKCSYTALMPEEGKKVDSQAPLIAGIGDDKDTFRLVEAFKVNTRCCPVQLSYWRRGHRLATCRARMPV
jgi:transcriptional regulator with XRE-family HTH domain